MPRQTSPQAEAAALEEARIPLSFAQELSNLPDCQHVATDYQRPTQQSYVGALERIILPGPLVKSLSALSQEEGASLFMTLLAAFQALLGRYSGQDDVVVGTPIANRNRLEVDSLTQGRSTSAPGHRVSRSIPEPSARGWMLFAMPACCRVRNLTFGLICAIIGAT